MRQRSANPKSALAPGLVLSLLLAAAPAARAQITSGPPSGNNQKASVSQWIGPVEVNIRYSSPDVHAPDGTDRRGKIWGELVPWGYSSDAFGFCGAKCPWRAGANQNTVLTVSHDVEIGGQRLAAGSYGLFMLPGKDEWTLILSHDSTSWGHYTYDESEDALRTTIRPQSSPYHEWLTYEFTDRQPEQATVALEWEDLAVPFTIRVPDVNAIYAEQIRHELRNFNGFDADSWRTAAEFFLDADYRPEEALEIARNAVAKPYTGEETFQNLEVLARAEEANGLEAEASATMAKAIALRTATPVDLHLYGRRLLAQGKKEQALRVFETNARRFPNEWPVNVGLARGYAAAGRNKEALKAARAALAQAPDEGNRAALARMVSDLEGKK